MKNLLVSILSILPVISIAQVSLEADVRPGTTANSMIDNLIVHDGKLFLTGITEFGISNLMSFDGSNLIVEEPAPDTDFWQFWIESEEFVVFEDTLYFIVDLPDEGMELWVFDGDSAYPELILDPTDEDGVRWPMTVFQEKLFFRGNDGSSGIPFGSSDDLWSYDGDTAVLELDAATTYGIWPGWWPYEFATFQNNLYMTLSTGSSASRELHRFEGNSMVTSVEVNPTSESRVEWLTEFDDKLFFKAEGDQSTGLELWSYDGVNVSLEADINPVPEAHGIPSYLTVYDNTLYFQATNGLNGIELFGFDGVSSFLAADINVESGSIGSSPRNFMVYAGRLFFQADDGIHGEELWVYDGNTASMVADINPGIGDSSPENLIVYYDKLYFTADDGTHGEELWSFFDPTVSIEENGGQEFDLKVYPNPSNGVIDIDLGQEFKNIVIRMVDMLGKEVYSTDAYSSRRRTVDLSSQISPGAYQLILESNEINKTITIIINE